MLANSQGEVKRYLDGTIKNPKQHQLNGFLIARFVNKMIDKLESFSPINKNAQQWSNIKMAEISFNQVKRKLETVL
ncbi:MAG: hypothetical protein ABI402_12485 [Ferruginibacter sp.]